MMTDALRWVLLAVFAGLLAGSLGLLASGIWHANFVTVLAGIVSSSCAASLLVLIAYD